MRLQVRRQFSGLASYGDTLILFNALASGFSSTLTRALPCLSGGQIYQCGHGLDRGADDFRQGLILCRSGLQVHGDPEGF